MRARIVYSVLILCVAAATVSAEPRYGICRAQLEADVAERFRQNITSIDFTYITSRGSRGGGFKSTGLVYTDGCPGYHVYDIYATEHDCESRAHYGTPPNYIRYRVSEGGC